MMLKVLKFFMKVEYLPSKELYIADTLSRDYLSYEPPVVPEMELVVHSVVLMNEASKSIFVEEVRNDPSLKIIVEYVQNGWPNDGIINPIAKRYYYKFKD